jgi:hypothetical protein
VWIITSFVRDRAKLWKKRRLIQNQGRARCLPLVSEDYRVESLQQLPNEIAKNREDFSRPMPGRRKAVARKYGTAEIGTSKPGFKKCGLSTARIAKDANPQRSLEEDGLSKFYD